MKIRLSILALLFLSAASPRARAEDLGASAQEGAALFDGGARYAAKAAPTAAPQDKASLLAELRKHVTIDDRGAPKEGAALNALLDRLMDSPTARAKAAQFIREGAAASLSFEEIPNTVIYEINGRKAITTSSGHAHSSPPPRVHLNAAYMEAGKDGAHNTLAHELFGHILEARRSARYGVSEVNDYSQDEEADAGLVGWTVSAELGNKLTDAWAWIYMADPQDYHKRLKSTLSYYAGTLSTEEMKNPGAAYETRLQDAEKLLLRLPDRKKKHETWLGRIEHLIDKHGEKPDSFLTLREKINASLKGLPVDEADLLKIKNHLQELITWCNSEAGAAWAANLAAKSGSAYFTERAVEMEERGKVLTGLLQGQTYDDQMPPPRPGQVTWDRLEELWKKDVESGCGGKP